MRLRFVFFLALLCAFSARAQQGQQGARSATTRQYPVSGAIGDAYFSIDPETRRIVTIADEDTTKYISQVLSNLDRPKPQVLIKVVFLEVTHNDSLDIGVEGGWAKNMGNSSTGIVANAFGMSALGLAPGSNGMPMNVFGQPVQNFAPIPPGAGLYQILGQNYQVTLRAIAQAGRAKILSRPSILTRNNQPATITVGQSVPLITSVRYDNFGNAINSVDYEDVGVILRVTPFITGQGLVEMIVQPEISSIDSTMSIPISSSASAPVINVRSADTVVVTPTGQTVIIGGLISNAKASAESKIPFLGDIPVMGNLFKRRQKTGQKSELMIFLTPYIVETPVELAALSETEQSKSGMRDAFSEQELNRFLDNLPVQEPDPGAPAKQKRSRERH